MSLPLAAQITIGILAGLLLIPLSIATLRAIIDGRSSPWVPGDIPAAEARVAAEGWPHRAMSAFDIAFNVIVLRGEQDETISTHSYRASLEGKRWGKLMMIWLNWCQPNHGPLATTGDYYRALVRVNALKKILGVQ